jgi:hypothetical protein
MDGTFWSITMEQDYLNVLWYQTKRLRKLAQKYSRETISDQFTAFPMVISCLHV